MIIQGPQIQKNSQRGAGSVSSPITEGPSYISSNYLVSQKQLHL